jgi:uncharacterized membrane protein
MDYDTIQPNYELRACSRQQLKGVWGQMVLAYFVFLLIYSPFYFFNTLDTMNRQDGYRDPLTSAITLILGLGVFITIGAFSLGFTGYFLKRVRGGEIVIKNIFDGFQHFGSALALTFFMGLFVCLWTLLLLVPGIIKGLGYSMAIYILHDNPGISPFDALKKSQSMMKGYKLKLFLLELSFIGWTLLGCLTIIGWLWVVPYQGLAIANFYENLKKNQEKALADKPAEGQTTVTQG